MIIVCSTAHPSEIAAPHFDKQNEDGVQGTLLSFGTNGKLSTFLSIEGLSDREQTSILKM